jgi:hypothetical protein
MGNGMSRATAVRTATITMGGDITVGRFGFGAMQLTGDQVWGERETQPMPA